MGPTSENAGYCYPELGAGAGCGASMGPTSENAGYSPVRDRRREAPEPASMGPTSENAGYSN